MILDFDHMKYKSFSKEIWERLPQALNEELKSNRRPVAAFDADGTLWDTDLGEAFFKWQIKNCPLSNMPYDPWKYYRDWKNSGDPRPAYLWLAQINHGQPLSLVQEWAEKAVSEAEPLPIFEDQKKLIEWLLEHNVEIYIVTASVKWAVEPGARRLGLGAEHVLGIETEVEKGIVSDRQSGTITYREGKLEALLDRTNGRRPFLASGNTMGDFALLDGATQISLAVGAAPEGHELYETEENLRSQARAKKWMSHRF